MLGEVSCDGRLLIPFSFQAAVFSILQQKIANFYCQYISEITFGRIIQMSQFWLGTTAAKREVQHDAICLDISTYLNKNQTRYGSSLDEERYVNMYNL